MFKITHISRIVLAICALALLIMLAVPIWYIYLTAPQYPEGLEMQIWHNNITGDVKVISALNHYIGMRAISVEMFPEFQYIGKAIMAVSGLCLILALIGRWWSAVAFWFVLAVGDSLALYDFWRWGYDYGHHLDPKAPIIIPGMAYQPPVLGYKKLLNFEAWSLPDTGGWVLMVVTGISLFIVVFEWWRHRKQKQQPAATTAKATAVAIFLSMFFWQCASGPQPIIFGKDNCEFCKMTLMDQRFGAEIVTKKGKVYKFDDLKCLVQFQQSDRVAAADIANYYTVDHAHAGGLINAEQAVFLQSDQLKSPMLSNIASFATLDALDQVKTRTGGNVLQWTTLQSTTF